MSNKVVRRVFVLRPILKVGQCCGRFAARPSRALGAQPTQPPVRNWRAASRSGFARRTYRFNRYAAPFELM